MTYLVPVVTKRQLPDYRFYCEMTITGMKVTCCVYEDRGSFRILREMYATTKSAPRWIATVQQFYQLACEHYPRQIDTVNVNKSGSL